MCGGLYSTSFFETGLQAIPGGRRWIGLNFVAAFAGISKLALRMMKPTLCVTKQFAKADLL